MYATSKPDLVVFHQKYYFYDGHLLGFCSVSPEVETESDEDDSDSYVLFGMAGEDKRQETGEKQVIAGMLLLATKLGVKAVYDNKFFSKAIIFGQLRFTDTNQSELYKLTMDFEERKSSITKGETPLETSCLLQCIKHVLDPKVISNAQE